MINFLNWICDLWDCICECVDSFVRNTTLWETLYNIADFIGIVAGIVVSAIAIVTFFRSYYFKRIKILGWQKSTNLYDGHKFSVSIQNRCLSTLSIKRVSIILDNIEEVILFYSKAVSADGPNISPHSIEPFKTDTFISEGSTLPLFDKGGLENYRKIVFCFTYSDNTQTKVRYKLKRIKENKFKTLFPKQLVFRSVRMTEHMMYIVERTDTSPNTQHIVFENGLIDSKIGIVSRIPTEHCNNSGALKKYLEESNKNMMFNVYPNPYYKGD